MKKGLRKLILSGAALAAVGATLGTSTYAWYVANDTVKATGITGASAATSAASIFISRNTTEWGSEVSLSGTIASGQIPDGFTYGSVGQSWVRGGNLIPVEYVGVTSNADTFKELGTINDQDAYVPATEATSAANGAAKQFTLFFRTSAVANADAAPTVYLKSLTIENTAEDADSLPAADNLNFNKSAAVGGVATSNATYKVDILKALAFTIHTNAETGENVNGKTFDPIGVLGSTYDSVGVTDASADALTYYNTFMETDYDRTMINAANVKKTVKESTESGTAISLGKLPYAGNTWITATFSIYLDGWDEFCFDACKGQNFNVNVQFTSDIAEALKF